MRRTLLNAFTGPDFVRHLAALLDQHLSAHGIAADRARNIGVDLIPAVLTRFGGQAIYIPMKCRFASATKMQEALYHRLQNKERASDLAREHGRTVQWVYKQARAYRAYLKLNGIGNSTTTINVTQKS